MNAWLKSPKAYAPGNKMSFAGLGKPEERAALMLWLNQQSGSPLTVPAAPAEEAPAATDDAPAEDEPTEA
jgi:cytochrome c